MNICVDFDCRKHLNQSKPLCSWPWISCCHCKMLFSLNLGLLRPSSFTWLWHVCSICWRAQSKLKMSDVFCTLVGEQCLFTCNQSFLFATESNYGCCMQDFAYHLPLSSSLPALKAVIFHNKAGFPQRHFMLEQHSYPLLFFILPSLLLDTGLFMWAFDLFC